MPLPDDFDELLRRADRAYAKGTMQQKLESQKPIIGPRPDQMIEDANAARELLLKGRKPTPRQLAALERAIRLQRPAPPCVDNGPTILPDPENTAFETWEAFQPILQRLQGSVARIDRIEDFDDKGRPIARAFATGLLVSNDALLTAGHVLQSISPNVGLLERGQARVEFRGYLNATRSESRDVIEVIAIDSENDLALLRIDPIDLDDNIRPALMPAMASPTIGQTVCIVGYPLKDLTSQDALVAVIFGKRFEVKRAAVGEIIASKGPLVFHDCSTLGGNSGSPVFDLLTGQVVGVHTGGSPFMQNAAVPGIRAREFVNRSLGLESASLKTLRSSSMKQTKPSFNSYYQDLRDADPELSQEMDAKIGTRTTNESTEGRLVEFTPETIVLTVGRPVLDIKAGAAVIDIAEVESQVWKKRLVDAKNLIAPNIPAVGRIELANHPDRRLDWLGTGWLIRDDIIVTNRHVAEVFGQKNGAGFLFRPGLDTTPMRASIDFLEEFDSTASEEFPLFEIVHIERGGGPDLAFLRIKQVRGQTLPKPVTLSATAADVNDQVAVIGYPARDPFFPEPDVMDRIFNSRYDKKRLAPGLITEKTSDRVFHDCTTLGGNSGAELISLKTGHAVALHFAGTLFEKNHAVPVDVVQSRLQDVLNGHVNRTSVSVSNTSEIFTLQSNTSLTPRVLETTIPIKIRIEIGDIPGAAATASAQPASTSLSPRVVDLDADDDLMETAEARPEDYRDRKGYQAGFLGSGFEVLLPKLTKNQDDVLTFQFDGSTQEVLNYHHFSVLMSKSRRMCRYSACNIDGKQSKRTSRAGWQFDPRIPKTAQIMKECYGNPPKFSRGHMTRREDPAWGTESDLGNRDSMHVTNTVPQIQPFNGGVWLGLEDYALQNARQDDMRISVFTGPFLSSSDPTRYDIKIPIVFWKIIAFIHDRTGELCATGYTMSQKSFIGEEEFIFGRHENDQRPIKEIEKRAGISFGRLAEVDPLKNQAESVSAPLKSYNDIQFVAE